MIDFIYTVQAHLIEQGTSISTIAALFFGLVGFMLTGYLVEHEINKGNKGE